ncbi:MAG: hypothetical protein OQL08_06825 [Gammaproteobacteria bacterium]|nr:hypothetical protein [Gammaproteobacteria bacterium]
MPDRIPTALYLLFILGSAILLYYPGLYGAFLMDDHGNLATLSDISATNTRSDIIAFTLNGVSSAIGRPISLFSFALQWESWPDNPLPFKLVNLLLHLANGLLIYLLSRQLLTLSLEAPRQVQWLSLAVTALWLLHPLQVSTVLYVVQRMTELAALFTLTGLLLYLRGRIHLSTTSPRGSYLYMTTGLGVGLVLGILSKENAILLCLYILVLEVTVLRDIARPRYWKYWAALFLLLPLLSLALYLLPIVIEYAFVPYPNRTFSSLERLFIQSHVLVDYLNNILLPRPNNFGLLRSDYSVELLSIGTLLKTALLLSLLIVGWRLRARFALLGMGILWFFAGHALESTVVNLELYFEHRNYLSLWGAIIAIIEGSRLLFERLTRQRKPLGRLTLLSGVGLWGAVVVLITLSEARLWANPTLQAAIWAQNSPRSHRAIGHLADTLIHSGQLEKAKETYKKGSEVLPHDINMLLNWQELQCVSPDIDTPSREALLSRLASGNYANSVTTAMEEIVDLKTRDRCKALENELLEAMLHNLLRNPNFQDARLQRNFHIFLANFYDYLKDYDQTTIHIQAAAQIRNSPDLLLFNADMQFNRGSKESYIVAVAKLDRFCSEHKTLCLLYKKEVNSHIEQATRLVNSQ